MPPAPSGERISYVPRRVAGVSGIVGIYLRGTSDTFEDALREYAPLHQARPVARRLSCRVAALHSADSRLEPMLAQERDETPVGAQRVQRHVPYDGHHSGVALLEAPLQPTQRSA